MVCYSWNTNRSCSKVFEMMSRTQSLVDTRSVVCVKRKRCSRNRVPRQVLPSTKAAERCEQMLGNFTCIKKYGHSGNHKTSYGEVWKNSAALNGEVEAKKNDF
jgi:hypothetical protein